MEIELWIVSVLLSELFEGFDNGKLDLILIFCLGLDGGDIEILLLYDYLFYFLVLKVSIVC